MPLYADAAYSSKATRDKLAKFGIVDRVQRKGNRDHLLTGVDKARNAEIAVTRSGGERPFAAYKLQVFPVCAGHHCTTFRVYYTIASDIFV
jgi:IS5 family transposase